MKFVKSPQYNTDYWTSSLPNTVLWVSWIILFFFPQYNIDYRTSPVPSARWRSGGRSGSYDLRSSGSDNEFSMGGPSEGLYHSASLSKPFALDKTGWHSHTLGLGPLLFLFHKPIFASKKHWFHLIILFHLILFF